MKINGYYPKNVSNIYQKQQQNTVSKEKKADKNIITKDSLQLSPQAQQISDLVKKVEELPEIRAEKIAEIKEKLANNTYQVPAAKLAAKMLSKK
ncbi:MAG: Anti-sigma-28 factor, FlgM [Clostridia bacterium]|jgi:negative regulator of flagellin synthesis FlgM|nr:Anti-sigma-28 factor, FlgM [Clostridia bacterium]